mmetsp:Transcript_4235/g.5522  ORF Transcript_4235/g.5522 Transcript_4235/m.5522 type:complete len:657 (-) Transcript_4235:150-2120(-)
MEMFAEAEDNYPVKSFVPEIIQSSPLAVSELNDQVNDLKDSHRVKRARIGEKACVEAQSDQSLPPVSLVPRGSAKRWSQEEEALLFSLIQELGQGKWAIIAQRLGTGRTPSGIEQHWQIMCGRRRRNHKSDIKSNFIQQHVSSIEQSQAYHNGFSSIQLEGSPMHVQYSPTSIQQEDEKHFSSQGDSSSSIGVSASIVPALVPIHRLPSVNKQQIQQSLPTDVNRIQTNSATSTLASTIASTMIQENYKVARRWTADEEIRLSALVEQLGRGKWRAIAQALGTGRSASAVEQHWQIQIGQRKRNTSSSRKSHQQQKQQQQRQQQLQQHVPNEQTSDSQGLIYGALPRRPLDDDDDDDACSGNNSSIKWLRIDALEPANVCLQTAAAFQSQIQTVDILFESPTSRLDGFVLGLTYFATHLQAASLITGMYWTHKTERWIPFGILIYYPIILIAIFLGLLWYLTVLIPCLGSKLSLALCLALATAARAALAILQEETNLFSEPKIHSIQLIYHAAFLFGLVIAATISIGLIPVVNGMLSTHVSRQIRGGRTQGGILHVSKVAMFVAVVAFAILTSLNRRNATWLVSPAVSTFAALVCVLWMHLKRNRCASCVVVPEATTFMNDFDTGNHPLQTCTDPDIAAQYGTFPGDMSNSFATMT